MTPLSPETTPPGDCSLTPSDSRLVSFLRRKIAGEPLPAAVAAHFHDTDIYAADPALLTTLFEPAAPAKKGESGSWFFFTRVRPKSSTDSRKSRQVAGGMGTWHSERAPRRVLDDGGNCAGHSQYFSYKRKTGKNCSERTEWYMVEFTDGDQEAGHHDRVHGGEPQLVLSKIYKAHTQSSRSGSGSVSRPSCSASARKRKAVDEASAPVKAKRRLFDSPAPAASAVSLQEQVTSKGWIAGEAATSLGKLGGTSDCAASTSKADISSWFPLMSMEDGKVATSQGKIGDKLDCISSVSKAGDEAAATPQLKIGDTGVFSRFWPEPEASFDWGCSRTGATLPTLENCSMPSVRDAGNMFCGRDDWLWPYAFRTGDDTTASVKGMPSAPVLPPEEASWWYGTINNGVWSF